MRSVIDVFGAEEPAPPAGPRSPARGTVTAGGRRAPLSLVDTNAAGGAGVVCVSENEGGQHNKRRKTHHHHGHAHAEVRGDEIEDSDNDPEEVVNESPTPPMRAVRVVGARSGNANVRVDMETTVELLPGEGLRELKAAIKRKFGKVPFHMISSLVCVERDGNERPCTARDLIDGAILRPVYVYRSGPRSPPTEDIEKLQLADDEAESHERLNNVFELAFWS